MTVPLPTQIERTVALGGAAGALALATEMLRQVYVYVQRGGETTVATEVIALGKQCDELRERVYALALAHEGRALP